SAPPSKCFPITASTSLRTLCGSASPISTCLPDTRTFMACYALLVGFVWPDDTLTKKAADHMSGVLSCQRRTPANWTHRRHAFYASPRKMECACLHDILRRSALRYRRR